MEQSTEEVKRRSLVGWNLTNETTPTAGRKWCVQYWRVMSQTLIDESADPTKDLINYTAHIVTNLTQKKILKIFKKFSI